MSLAGKWAEYKNLGEALPEKFRHHLQGKAIAVVFQEDGKPYMRLLAPNGSVVGRMSGAEAVEFAEWIVDTYDD